MPRLVVRIDAPVVVVGQPFEVGIEVIAEAETKIGHVVVRVTGREGWSTAGVYRKEPLPHLELRLATGATLRKGSNRMIATFTIPQGPPTHELDPAWARYEIHARVVAGWWRGVGIVTTLQVRAAPPSTMRYPLVARTNEAEPVRLEISLASSRVIAGEVVAGRCAVHGLPDNHAREVQLAIEPVLVLKSNIIGAVVIRHHRAVMQAVLPAGTGGTSVPFAFTVPADATPTFRTLSHELYRELVITTGELRLMIPLEILDPTATMAPMPVAPPLGGEHVGAVFDVFAAAHSWRRDYHGTSHAVVRTLDDVTLQLECDYRGKDGTWLVATATYPSLGLGLQVAPASLLRNVLGDVSIGDPEWDRAYDVQARSPEQARPFVAAVAPSTQRLELGTMTRWTDESIVFEQAVDAVDEAQLGSLADALTVVVRSIEEHRASIDASPEIDIDRELIRALARELRGRIAFGDLAIDGWLGGIPVVIRTHWERVRATHIVVVVGSTETATELARMVEVSIPHPSNDSLQDPEAKRLVALASWHVDMVELRVTGGVASAELRLDVRASRVAIDVERLKQLVEALHAIRVALEPASGPYR